jgi:small subunit ribosomal protein S2
MLSNSHAGSFLVPLTASFLQRFNQKKGFYMSNFNFTMRDLLEAGVHYGHRKNFWNPKMSKYIYGARNGIHIMDLGQTAPMLRAALDVLKDVASRNGRILFVGTKKQASEIVAAEATRCGQYFVNHRWLGGMLTNWSTVSASIKTMQKYEELLSNPEVSLTKKEKLDIDRKRIKLDAVLGGIRNMGGKPDLLFVIDTNLEKLAITEAKKLGIPIVAVVDTNSNPDNIDYIIPGNDDARKAIELYARLASDAVLGGIQESLSGSGIDIGAIDIVSLEQSVLSSDIEIKSDEEESISKKKVTGGKKPATVVTKKSAKKVEAEVEVEPSEKVEVEDKAKLKPAVKAKAETASKTKAKKATEKE